MPHILCILFYIILSVIGGLHTFLEHIGYLGIFLISFFGNIIIFAPIPYYFPILIAAAFNKHLDPNLISLSGAAGSVTAKLIIFYAIYYGRNIILNTNTKKRMAPLQKLLSRYGWLGAFLAALTPIPDEIVYIPLGLAKYSPWKFTSAIFAGKFVLNEAIVWGAVILGRPFIERFFVSSGTNSVYLIIAAIVILGIILYLFLKLDWNKIIGKWFGGPTTVEEGKKGGE
ncbi:MAG TPA: VTT domain-containing protein [Nitrososphaeraceae archaeon]|nr:VTT domain-containing protein [Nitrososphaeraceae archaeon]